MSIVVNGGELVSQANMAAGPEGGRQQEISAEERSMVLALSHVTPQQAAALRLWRRESRLERAMHFCMPRDRPQKARMRGTATKRIGEEIL